MPLFPAGKVRRAVLASVCALVLSSTAVAQEERNHDARLDHNAGFRAAPQPGQMRALAALRAEMPELQTTHDAAFGVTRSLYNATGYLTASRGSGAPEAIALDFVRAHLDALGLTEKELAGYEVTDEVFSQVSGATHLYLRQTYSGLPIYNAQLHVNLNRDNRIISVNNAFVPGLPTRRGPIVPRLDAAAAVEAAARQLGLASEAPLRVIARSDDVQQTTRLAASGLSLEDIEARLMWVPIRTGDVRLVWSFQVQTLDNDHWFDLTVDADSGQIWTRFDWMASHTYRVYEQPIEDPTATSPGPPADGRTLVVDPENATASPNGWFSGSGIMDGNNVHACADVDRNNSCDSPQPQCSGGLCDFPLDLTLEPGASQAAAITNLFYWNNVIHDIQYQYGFDEAGGNFQENNFGRGGVGSDSVNADAQDTSFPSPCNANFGTPADGGNPRMQMFLCDNTTPDRDGDYDNGVIVHEYGHGISNRQVGGPSAASCLGNRQQAGEGWSDWLALAYTATASDTGPQPRGLGSYLFDASVTIRDLPYSTNPAVNNWTYESINGARVPHGVGSRWAQVAWEVYWALVDQYGFEGDLVSFDINDPNEAGNKRVMFYVNEGLKNTACSPTFVNSRDGMIQAAMDNFGGADVCLLWETFAAFGLGTDAISGGSGSTRPTNGFSLPASCTDPPPPPCNNELFGATFESGSDGWTDGASTCTTGTFVVGSPDATTWQVGGGSGSANALFTQPNAGGLGTDDVDGGTCETLSPVISAAGQNAVDITLDYFHGQRDAGDDAGDGFTIEVLNNGAVAATMVAIGDVTNNPAWTTLTATVQGPGDLQLRVRASDAAGPGDIVEAGIDNVRVCSNDDPPPPDCSVDDDFEAGAGGWANSGAATCATGAFVLGSPTEQTSGGVTTQVGGASSGINAIFTATNTSAGNADVDGGACILVSPVFPVAEASTFSARYFHGQRDAGDDAAGDFFALEVSIDGGATFTAVASNGDAASTAVWTTATASIPAGSDVQIRVRVSDGAGPGDIIEAGIDDVSICAQ